MIPRRKNVQSCSYIIFILQHRRQTTHCCPWPLSPELERNLVFKANFNKIHFFTVFCLYKKNAQLSSFDMSLSGSPYSLSPLSEKRVVHTIFVNLVGIKNGCAQRYKIGFCFLYRNYALSRDIILFDNVTSFLLRISSCLKPEMNPFCFIWRPLYLWAFFWFDSKMLDNGKTISWRRNLHLAWMWFIIVSYPSGLSP